MSTRCLTLPGNHDESLRSAWVNSIRCWECDRTASSHSFGLSFPCPVANGSTQSPKRLKILSICLPFCSWLAAQQPTQAHECFHFRVAGVRLQLQALHNMLLRQPRILWGLEAQMGLRATTVTFDISARACFNFRSGCTNHDRRPVLGSQRGKPPEASAHAATAATRWPRSPRAHQGQHLGQRALLEPKPRVDGMFLSTSAHVCTYIP